METKYSIQIFKNNGLNCSWATVQVGWDLKCLDADEVGKFAIDFLETHPNVINEWISEFIFGVKDYEVEELLKRVFKSLKLEFPMKKSSLWNQEWRKWRYCMISETIKNVSDVQDLLIKIDGIYVDFGYPEDMISFIYYMPSDEVNNEGHEKSCAHLAIKINNFFKEERERIDKGCDILPRIMYIDEDDNV